MLILSRAAGACLLSLLVASNAAHVQAPPYLYATARGKADLLVIDPGSGVVVQRIHKKEDGHQSGIVLGLAYLDGLFYAIDGVQSGSPDVLIRIHPADGRVRLVSTVGFDPYTHRMDIDPTSGKLYTIYQQELYSIDPHTGSVAFVAPLSPSANFVDALAIDRNGVAYGTLGGFPAPLNIPMKVYRVDLTNGNTTLIGTIDGVYGAFYDLAFSPDGSLWGSLRSGIAGLEGIYRINLASMNAIQVAGMTAPYGIAFVDPADISTYCTAKTGSLGCTPAISSFGVPSPTASSGFIVRAQNVLNGVPGVLVYSTAPGSAPFLGGTLCVGNPLMRSAVQGPGGTAGPPQDCTGNWEVDLNAEMAANGTFPAGTALYCQWWARDPLSAPHAASLSEGLRVVLQP